MYKALIENIGDSRYFATTNDYSFVLDTEGRGANPVNTLLASLCGCIGHYVCDYLHEQQISYLGFSIVAEAGLTFDKTRLSIITLWIDMKGAELGEQHRSELLIYVERCKVHAVLKEGCTININFGRPPQSGSVPLAQAARG